MNAIITLHLVYTERFSRNQTVFKFPPVGNKMAMKRVRSESIRNQKFLTLNIDEAVLQRCPNSHDHVYILLKHPVCSYCVASIDY